MFLCNLSLAGAVTPVALDHVPDGGGLIAYDGHAVRVNVVTIKTGEPPFLVGEPQSNTTDELPQAKHAYLVSVMRQQGEPFWISANRQLQAGDQFELNEEVYVVCELFGYVVTAQKIHVASAAKAERIA